MLYLEYLKQKVNHKQICFYPMGIAAKATMHKLEKYGIQPVFFSDKNEKLWGSEYQGIPCISLKTLAEQNQDELVVIVESLYYKEIKKDLEKLGIKHILRVYPEKLVVEEYLQGHPEVEVRAQIADILELCADEKSKNIYKHLTDAWWMDDVSDDYFSSIYEKGQYFDKTLIDSTACSNFVDAGAYIGDTVDSFLDFTSGNYEKLHLFELDSEIYGKLKKNVEKLPQEKVQCYSYGLGNENVTIHYFSGDSNSSIKDCDLQSGGGTSTGELRKLDDVLANEKVTFIKMDIEGAETDALKGAETIIKTQHPTLAICMYHSPQDMLHIPKLIKEMVPEYRIYIRHYTDLMLETVCYAIPK